MCQNRAKRTRVDIHGLRTLLRPMHLALAMIAASHAVTPAEAGIVCGALHTVERGETLFKIAKAAYGDGDQYLQIFEANRDLLPDPSSLEVGDQIVVPCGDGTGAETRRGAASGGELASIAGAAAPIIGPQTEQTPRSPEPPSLQGTSSADAGMARPSDLAAFNGPLSPIGLNSAAMAMMFTVEEEQHLPKHAIKFVSGTGFEPYVDALRPGGGMIPDLIRRASDVTAPGTKVQIAFVNDWPAHLAVLLSDGYFDVSFPWFKPDCSASGSLDAEAQFLCDEFLFSRPFVEVPFKLYQHSNSAGGATMSQAGQFGERLCRQIGRLPLELEQKLKGRTDVSVVTTETAYECLVKLVRGEVDTALLNGMEAATYVQDPEFDQQLVEIPALSTTSTLHAIIHKSNPNREMLLTLLDGGMATLMRSGIWFETVSYHQRTRIARAD